jgi:hypothetical protein
MAKRPPAPAPSTEQTRTVCGLCAVFLPFLRQAGAAAWGLQYKSYVAASWKACSALGLIRCSQNPAKRDWSCCLAVLYGRGQIALSSLESRVGN